MEKNNKKKDFFLFREIITSRDKESLLENLSVMLDSGISVLDSLKSLKEESTSKGIRNLIEEIEDDINNGNPFWKAIENSKLLPQHYLSIIKIGEESGRLSTNIKIVTLQQEKNREFRSKLRSASIYPAFVLILLVGIGIGVSLFVLPRLTGVYKSLNIELPWITQVFISIGEFMDEYGGIVVPGFIILFVVIFFILFINKRTKHIGQAILLRTPVLKRIISQIELSRMGFLLGTLLDAGLPILDSFILLVESTEYRRFKKFYYNLGSDIEKGLSIKQSLDGYKNTKKVLPTYAKQLIISAEQSGNLPQTFIKIGEIYEKKNDENTKDLTVLLEPILLLLVWIGVAFIALAVILPIYSLIGGVNEAASPNRTIQNNERRVVSEPVDINL